MKASELVEILERPLSVLEKAQIIMDGFSVQKPSALNVKPDKQRKKRQQKAPGVVALSNTNGADIEHAQG